MKLPELVRCALVLETEVVKAEDGDWVVATSPRPDRSDDVVEPSGLALAEFLANPIGLWQHDRHEPVCTWEIKAGTTLSGSDALLVRPTFAAGEAVPTARKVEALWSQKVVRGVSIGFRPTEGTPRTNLPSDHPYYKKDSWGMYYAKGVLREVSIVTIPCQPDAVRRGEEGVIDLGDLSAWPPGLLSKLAQMIDERVAASVAAREMPPAPASSTPDDLEAWYAEGLAGRK